MRPLQLSFLLAAFLCATLVRAEPEFVELTADIEMVSWERSFYDPPTFESRLWKFRCVVGTNSWFLTASNEVTSPETWFYSGSNLVHKYSAGFPNLPKPGETNSTPITGSFDFNGDLDSGTNGPFLGPHFRVAWLAFCSGPFLNRERRQIPLPNVFWKQSWLYFDHAAPPIGFPDKVMQFEDDLALPLSLDIFTKAGQPLLQYHIKHAGGPHVLTTNLLGWEFPLDFRAIQYLPVKGAQDKWQADLLAHGVLTSIKVGTPPKLTSAVHQRRRADTNFSYTLKAGGPVSYNLITNPPELNKARIALSKRQDDYNNLIYHYERRARRNPHLERPRPSQITGRKPRPFMRYIAHQSNFTAPSGKR